MEHVAVTLEKLFRHGEALQLKNTLLKMRKRTLPKVHAPPRQRAWRFDGSKYQLFFFPFFPFFCGWAVDFE